MIGKCRNRFICFKGVKVWWLLHYSDNPASGGKAIKRALWPNTD
ncbi:hypothetical protein [Morganella morganii IS15]|nr:hypothetical protein [Morganella morganii IS15]